MFRLLAAACFAVLISTAATAAAEEPVRLDDPVLDAVTAGAVSGARLTALAQSPVGTAQASIAPTNQSGAVSAGAGAGSSGDTAFAQIGGVLYNRTTPLSSVSVGLYQGQVSTEGRGVARTSVEGIAEGRYAIGQGNVFTIPGSGGRQIGYSIGIAFGPSGNSG